MKTVTLPLDKLIPYAGNPRKNDHAVEQVASAIKRFGFRVPVLAKSDGSLIDGHLRVKAAKHLGMEEVPVVLCDDLSEADIKALRISINRMAELADWDNPLLAIELQGLADIGILSASGFTQDELADLLKTSEVNIEFDEAAGFAEGDQFLARDMIAEIEISAELSNDEQFKSELAAFCEQRALNYKIRPK